MLNYEELRKKAIQGLYKGLAKIVKKKEKNCVFCHWNSRIRDEACIMVRYLLSRMQWNIFQLALFLLFKVYFDHFFKDSESESENDGYGQIK